MKVAYTSDIHTDITQNNKLLIPYLVQRIEEINPDIFVVAGDISNSLEGLDITLKEFAQLNCLKIMVPGNHDVWIESNNSLRKGKDSFYKYRQSIPRVCKQNGFIYPIWEPYIINDVAIVGNIGWYDYTLSDSRLDKKYSYIDYERGIFDNNQWNDINYAAWLKSPNSLNWKQRQKKFVNEEIFNFHFNEFKKVLQQIPENIEKVLVVLHTAPFMECIVPKEEPDPFDAYEGSIQIGELIESFSSNRKVSIVCGHRHKKLFLERGNIKLFRSPIGYLDKSQKEFKNIAEYSIGEFYI